MADLFELIASLLNFFRIRRGKGKTEDLPVPPQFNIVKLNRKKTRKFQFSLKGISIVESEETTYTTSSSKTDSA
jgi:hypothetical protein